MSKFIFNSEIQDYTYPMRTIDSAWQILQDDHTIDQMQYALRLLMLEYKRTQQADPTNEKLLETYARELLEISDALNAPLERALSRIELAILNAKQGLFARAYKHIEQAVNILQNCQPSDEASQKTFATAFWLMGCLQIQLGKTRARILQNWQHAMNVYEMLQHHPLIGNAGWYAFRLRHMQAEMKAFMQEIKYAPQVPTGFQQENMNSFRSSTNQPALPIMNLFDPAVLYSSSHPSLDIFNVIPAGPLADLEDSCDTVETIPLAAEQNSFVIEGGTYQLFSLFPGQRAIRLLAGVDYAVLKVRGDSMDMANIENNDYVLIRRQDTASSGDIVAAQFFMDGAAPRSTLKRFENTGRQIHLHAESKNPANQSYSIDETEWNTQVQIVGIVQGIFKPGNIWVSSD